MTFISRLTVAAAALLFTAAAVGARDHWVPDTIALGHDFENLTIALPSDSDTPCTVVRLCADSAITSHRGVLYIHGFNDYFSKQRWPTALPPTTMPSMLSISGATDDRSGPGQDALRCPSWP